MRNRRSGFTLIEMLIVVGLIAFLATILIVAVRGGVSGAREQATKATITKVSGLLRQRTDAFNRINFDSTFAADITKMTQQLGPLAAGDLATVVTKKYIYGLHFPQTWAEVNGFIKYRYNVQDPTVVFTTPTSITPKCESAEVLYWLITNDKATVPGYTQEGTDNFTGAVADTDNNGAMEFVDGWGQPLRWYRWPTRLIRMNPRTVNPPTWVPVTMADIDISRKLMPDLPLDPVGHASNPAVVLSQDPDDPTGLIEMAYENQLLPAFSAPTFEDAYHTIGTYFSPLIVSAGQDGVLGLYEPSDRGMARGYWGAPINSTAYYDDITNHQIKSGGK